MRLIDTDAIEEYLNVYVDPYEVPGALYAISKTPTVEIEPLTDKEKRLFLSAMEREVKVCKEVDAEMTREPYEDTLVLTCHKIIRKVKGVLWS